MDSINKQQPEDNFKNLNGSEAIGKLKDLAEQAKSCFFCSNIKTGIPLSVRPMAVQKVDDEGNLWFLSSKDSHKNDELVHDPFVHLLFQGSAHSDFLNIYGIATTSDDKEKIKELWEPVLKTWFTGGEDDPRISVIKVEPISATLDGLIGLVNFWRCFSLVGHYLGTPFVCSENEREQIN